jgi:hypothetical protein
VGCQLPPKPHREGAGPRRAQQRQQLRLIASSIDDRRDGRGRPPSGVLPGAGAGASEGSSRIFSSRNFSPVTPAKPTLPISRSRPVFARASPTMRSRRASIGKVAQNATTRAAEKNQL